MEPLSFADPVIAKGIAIEKDALHFMRSATSTWMRLSARKPDANTVDTQRSKRFATIVDVRFTETWNLDGHVRTGEQVLGFSDETVAKIPGTIVHWFQLEFDSVLYEFKLVGSQAEGFNTDADLTAMFDQSDLSKCWMNGHESIVFPWEPSDDD